MTLLQKSTTENENTSNLELFLSLLIFYGVILAFSIVTVSLFHAGLYVLSSIVCGIGVTSFIIFTILLRILEANRLATVGISRYWIIAIVVIPFIELILLLPDRIFSKH